MCNTSDYTESATRKWRTTVITVVVLAVGVVSALLVATSSTFVRKLLMAAIHPTAILWLAIVYCAVHSMFCRRKTLATLLAIIAIGYGICGNNVFAGFVLGTLEDEYRHFHAATLEPLDALIVLGGGTSGRRNGDPQLNCSGDRVMLAARLYHLGKAKRLITSGDPIPEIGIVASGADSTLRMWREIGIPAEHIVLGRGASTSEEMQHAREYLAKIDGRRVGLLTSAWHMPRALRLANKNGLDVIPVPADFWTDGPPSPLAFNFIPSSHAFGMTHRALLEYVAWFAGR